MKRLIMVLILLGCFCFAAAQVYAVPAEADAAAKITDVGNKFCPVSGDKVSGNTFVVHQGKRYGLCCPMCEKTFLADPDKYLAKMKAQEAVAAEPKAAPTPMAMEKGEHEHQHGE